jgi:uncharacterized protein (DUF2267 family)
MDYDTFLEIVQQAAGIGREDADHATRATVAVLSTRIARGEARALAAELPPEVAASMEPGPYAERFDVDEFLRRIARREGIDLPTAERRATAVFAALGRAVSAKELDDMAAQLPKDFAPLLPRGPDVPVMPADEFVVRVAERAGLDPERARRATNAVLETLAERIAGGEVDDLVARTPPALHEPLKRGKEHSDDRARRMGVEDFIARVASREGASPIAAYEHAQAVFPTLREAVSDEEFFDVTVQLPDEYAPVVTPTGAARR